MRPFTQNQEFKAMNFIIYTCGFFFSFCLLRCAEKTFFFLSFCIVPLLQIRPIIHYIRRVFPSAPLKHLKISNDDTFPTSGFPRLAVNIFSVTYLPRMSRERRRRKAAGAENTDSNSFVCTDSRHQRRLSVADVSASRKYRRCIIQISVYCLCDVTLSL